MQPVRYARAAAAVLSCAFTITPDLRDKELPYVGETTLSQIQDIAEEGTALTLEAFRSCLF